MEETLGKRIAAHRKRLGLTQDKLAETLGVTAQAVSKWENDQTCPDITMLPKLAIFFGTTTDQLLGLEQPTVHTAEVVTEPSAEDQEPNGFHFEDGKWEMKWDGGRRSYLGLALWVLLSGALLLITETGLLPGSYLLHVPLWDILWPAGLLVFGLFGLYPSFSALRLGCALFGCYSLLVNFSLAPFDLGKKLLLPIFLLLFGLSLLLDALKKPRKGSFHLFHNGKNVGINKHSFYTTEEGTFHCATSFGENHHRINLPRLTGGEAQVSFGELEIDLSGCEEIAPNCCLVLNCSFGELELLVPRRYRAESLTSTSFASLEIQGDPASNAVPFTVDGSASFGQITVRYI